jgi:adenylate cyclase class IV
MARNIEIKARLESLDALLPRAQALAAGPPELIQQDDTFFHCTQGRLKLRVFADGGGELIHYRRDDTPGPMLSDYVRVPVPEPDLLREALGRGCGVAGRVVKRRWLLMVGQTRVHLDDVQGLGQFIELEVVLREAQSAEQGVAIAEALMQALGLANAPRLAGAYVDLPVSPS